MENRDRVDVFVRVYAEPLGGLKSSLRWGMSIATLARWRMQEDANLTVLSADAIIQPMHSCVMMPEKNFHIESKREAERRATTPIYVIADDDALPLGKNFIEQGVKTLARFADYGLVGATSISDGQYPAGKTFRYGEPQISDVEKTESAGGIVFVRRGVINPDELPNCDADQVDETVCTHVRKRGFKVGLLPHVRFNHLGSGFSVTSKGEGNWLS